MAAGGHDRINVQNNPVNAIDPYGLFGISDFFGAVDSAVSANGKGALIGGLGAGTVGTLIGGPLVGVPAAFIGAQIGGTLDGPSAGQLNHGEDEMLKRYYEDAEIRRMEKELKEWRELVDYYNEHSGGYPDGFEDECK